MSNTSLSQLIDSWICNSILLTVKVLKMRGNSAIYHGRIINYFPDGESILLYNDDAKQVENISLMHVEDIHPASSSILLH